MKARYLDITMAVGGLFESKEFYIAVTVASLKSRHLHITIAVCLRIREVLWTPVGNHCFSGRSEEKSTVHRAAANHGS